LGFWVNQFHFDKVFNLPFCHASALQIKNTPQFKAPLEYSSGVLNININIFLGLFFTLFLFHEGGWDGGQAGGEIWGSIEFIAARLPTLQIGV